jgi:hypothetical protein
MDTILRNRFDYIIKNSCLESDLKAFQRGDDDDLGLWVFRHRFIKAYMNEKKSRRP